MSFVGKAATACLLYAFPLLFLGAHHGTLADVTRVTGWAMAIWGTALYWCAAVLYSDRRSGAAASSRGNKEVLSR